ncbi:hypothetical protein [Sulfitobacter sp. 20_GPM-1509m]|uniref:hypothetical protein n=1 Tax=Sulfitobacter sp. 20_GPM-1509m TaxID=1380367 RepID=UPI00048DD790|nr:hypothetical protein [Sulfitobacter sp. 20_GPM-1509m]
MTQISSRPRIKLSKLRDIGWTLWDPIGLLSAQGVFHGKWNEQANQGIADEYDGYLISAASQLRSGEPLLQVIEYLVQVESEHMALGIGPTTRERAVAVVTAIMSDDTIWTWPDEQGRFR